MHADRRRYPTNKSAFICVYQQSIIFSTDRKNATKPVSRGWIDCYSDGDRVRGHERYQKPEFFAISSVDRLQIRGSESRTLVLPNRTNRSSPGSFDRVIPQSGCAFGRLSQNRSCRPGLLRSEGGGLSCSRGFLVPACRCLGLPSRSRVRSGA